MALIVIYPSWKKVHKLVFADCWDLTNQGKLYKSANAKTTISILDKLKHSLVELHRSRLGRLSFILLSV
jgi:hypothetical protein